MHRYFDQKPNEIRDPPTFVNSAGPIPINANHHAKRLITQLIAHFA